MGNETVFFLLRGSQLKLFAPACKRVGGETPGALCITGSAAEVAARFDTSNTDAENAALLRKFTDREDELGTNAVSQQQTDRLARRKGRPTYVNTLFFLI